MKIKINGNSYEISKINILICLLITVILVLVISIYMNNTNELATDVKIENNKEISDDDIVVNKKNDSDEVLKNKQNEDSVKVYIIGCIKKPGIVTIKKGDLLTTVIEKAGGVTSEADLNAINMVFKIERNMMLKVLTKTEIKENIESSANQDGIKIIDGMGEGIKENNTIQSSQDADGNSKININSASLNDLLDLPGIGEVLANNIIKFRENNGGFKSIDELKQVNGIGEKKFADIKDLVIN